MLHKLPPDVLLRIVWVDERSADTRVLRSGRPLRVLYLLSQLSRSLRSFAQTCIASLTEADFRHVDTTTFLTGKTVSVLAGGASLASFCAVYATLNDASLRPLLQSSISRLEVRGLRGVTSRFLGDGTHPVLNSVQYLDMSYVDAVTSDTVAALASLTQLKTLILEGCRHFTDRDLQALCHTPVARSVRTLNIKYCQIGDDTVAAILEHFSLTKLILAGGGGNLWSVGSHTQAGIDALQEKYKNVNISFEI